MSLFYFSRFFMTDVYICRMLEEFNCCNHFVFVGIFHKMTVLCGILLPSLISASILMHSARFVMSSALKLSENAYVLQQLQ